MKRIPRYLVLGCVFVGCAAWILRPSPGLAYVEAPMSLGAVVAQASHIMLMRVEAVDKDKNIIIYRKILDIKGKHPQEVIKHNIGRGGLRPNEWKPCMDWAEPGRIAAFFHNGGASETCIGTWWYQAYAGGEWWNHSHGEPFLLRSYSGPPEKLAGIVSAMLEGKETVAPCMVDGNKEDLHNRRAKIQRLKVSLKIQDYNPKRDFVGWGGEDFRRLQGLPGFTHISGLARIEEPQAISLVDFNNDGKTDVCLVGAGKLAVLQNGGEAMSEFPLPVSGGARAVLWADYNNDGLPDLFLATPAGPKLITNLGDRFRDDSYLLPQEPFYHLTTAGWIDYNNDGKPDLLLANGYHGLRLYKNIGVEVPKAPLQPKYGRWHVLGPFNNANNAGFNTRHPVEKDVDLKAVWVGKGDKKIEWKETEFPDGSVVSLHPAFPGHPEWCAAYLYREIVCEEPADVPCSFGSDDTLQVWLNGTKIIEDPSHRGAGPDQNLAKLKLQKGKNQLVMKIGNGGGDWGFYFLAQGFELPRPKGPAFVDVSAEVGLGPQGLAGNLKCESLTIADFNGDGRADVLLGAGQGMLLSTRVDANGLISFVEQNQPQLRFQPGKVGPALADVNGDGFPDLGIPQKDGIRLFLNDGKGVFSDITARTGGLAQKIPHAASVAWGDFDNDGLVDLLVGCLKGPNRLFRNLGNNSFEDITDAVGLSQKWFNTRAAAMVDLNNDGMLDLIFNNEGQDSVVLLGNPASAGKGIPLSFTLQAREGVIGSRVTVTDAKGLHRATAQIAGAEGRGGQAGAFARFVLQPGQYQVQFRTSHGQVTNRAVTLTDGPVRASLGD